MLSRRLRQMEGSMQHLHREISFEWILEAFIFHSFHSPVGVNMAFTN